MKGYFITNYSSMDYDIQFYKVNTVNRSTMDFLEVVEKLSETPALFRFWCSYKKHCEHAILNYK